MANNNIPFLRGENVVIKLYQNGNPVVLLAKNWNVSQEATEVSEGVNGEDRDRLDLVTNSFSGSVDVYQEDADVIQAIIDNQKNEDAGALPLVQAGAVQKRYRDGTKRAYVMRELKMGPFNETMTSRQDSVMINVKFRFRYYEPVQSF